MLIKATSSKGDPILYGPEESLPFAVEYGVKKQNTLEKVYWVTRDSIRKSAIHFNKSSNGHWEAIAEGTASIGYTDAKTDRFYDAKPHTFKIQYRPYKDDLGLPDVEVTKFEIAPVQQDPAATMNF